MASDPHDLYQMVSTVGGLSGSVRATVPARPKAARKRKANGVMGESLDALVVRLRDVVQACNEASRALGWGDSSGVSLFLGDDWKWSARTGNARGEFDTAEEAVRFLTAEFEKAARDRLAETEAAASTLTKAVQKIKEAANG
jgi:hypothetical protein